MKGKLVATFRHNPKNYKSIYPSSTAILLISVGQHYHEGEKFEATIDLINRSGFQKCTVMLGDLIQRHNISTQQNIDIQEAAEQAKKFGDEWLERNREILSRLKIPYEIKRWDQWLHHKLYEKFRKMIDQAYEKDRAFKNAFNNSADKFIKRFAERLDYNFNSEEVFKTSLEYLQEECAIIMPLWAEVAPHNYIIYPGFILRAMRATHDFIVKPTHENISQWLPVRFKRKALAKKTCDKKEDGLYKLGNKKLRYKAAFKSPPEYKSELEGKNCLLTISVGQPYHEGDKFLSTIKLVNDKQFKECLVMVCDTLQRHNLRMLNQNIDETTAWRKSLLKGDSWLKNQEKALDSLNIPFRIIRWDDLICHSDYQEKFHIIASLYEEDPFFKKSVLNTTQEFLARASKRLNKYAKNLDLIEELSQQYVLEECAVMLIMAKTGCHYDIYPKKRNNAMTYIHQFVLDQNLSNFLKPLAIKFSKRKDVCK